MLTAVIAAMAALQSAPGTVVWEQPAAPEPVAAEAPARTLPDLPGWARPDPFAWERAQCSPLVRGAEEMGACQVRVRGDLFAVLGEDLPEGLRPSVQMTDCSPQPDGNYALACNARVGNPPSGRRRNWIAAVGPSVRARAGWPGRRTAAR